MKTVRVAGVPEHFNFPWHLALEEGAFAEEDIGIQWTDVPEGSGKMCEMLRRGETEIAVVLTEAAVKSRIEGNPIRIVQEFIGSPLLWGIHVAASSPFRKVAQLEGHKAAISRPGSGSHLMAFLHARHMGWDPHHLQFEIVHQTEGAVQALTEGQAAYFLWEHFTTKPLVTQKIFRRLGDFPSPWPCFVLAVPDHFLKADPTALKKVLEVLNRYSGRMQEIPGIDRILARRYGQEASDIHEWLKLTRWSQSQIESNIIDNVVNSLYDLKLINKVSPAEKLLHAMM